jgi:hypothetical protein
MIREQIFINNGELYKEVTIYEGYQEDPYILDEESDDPITFFYKLVDGNKKIYRSSNKLREFLSCSTNAPEADISSFDICPLINFIAGTATIENTTFKELFFAIENSDILLPIAEYYNLSYPTNPEINNVIDNSPGTISSYWSSTGEEVVLGSIQFVDGYPKLFKVYALYKDHDKWDMLNRGRVFENTKVIEEGGWYVSRHLLPKYESTTPSASIKYVRTSRVTADPLVCWDAVITDDTTKKVVTKHYESSKMVRAAICNMTNGSNYEEYNKAPMVTWWLGKSWIVDGDEEELFFHVESKDMLDDVCYYYNLPVPYSAELEPVLTENLKSIRFKSYDLLNLGEGNFVEVVVASVVFTEGVPTAIRLYEIKRPNE